MSIRPCRRSRHHAPYRGARTVRLAAVTLLMAAAAPLLAVTPATGPRLLPVRQAIPCADFAGELVDLAWSGGRIHLLDARELVVWSLDREGGDRQVVEVPGLRPECLFFGCGGRLHVVDPWARTVSIRQAPGRWARVPTGHRVFRGDGDADGLILTGPRAGIRPLAQLVSCGGDTLAFGQGYRIAHRHHSLTRNANYTHVAVGDTMAVVAHRALGHLRVHRRDGRHVGDFHLSGEAPVRLRRWYLPNAGRTPGQTVSAAPETLLADLAAAATPGEFPIPIYVNDLAIHDGLIHVLVSGVLQVYTPAGELLQSFEPPAVYQRRRVSIHEIAFTDAGELLGLDARHYAVVYRFGPLPSPTAPGVADSASGRGGIHPSEGSH